MHMNKKEYKYLELEDKKEIWDSDIDIITPKVIIEQEVINICQSIQKQVNNNEFSILFKGYWTSKGFKVTSEYVIPKQEVTTVTVDYKEDLRVLREQGFNVAVHSHPFTNNPTFSSVDDDYINAHFPVALLLNNKSDVCLCNLMIQINDSIKLSIPTTDISILSEVTLPDIIISDITVKKEVVTYPYEVYKTKKKRKKRKKGKKNILKDNYGLYNQPDYSLGGFYFDK